VRGFQPKPAEGFQGGIPLVGADPTPFGEKELRNSKSILTSKGPNYRGSESFVEYLHQNDFVFDK